MARTRTARVLAAAASVPLAFVLLGGVAQADNGGWVSNVNTQVAAGHGINTNQANNANVIGNGNDIDQSNRSTNLVFTQWW